jgi:hypothetical protein
MQVLCPEDVIGFRYYSSEHPQIRRCSMHLSGASVFPEHDPWVPNVNLSVVKWLPCDVLTKISSDAQCRDVVWASDAQAPEPGVGGPEVKMSHYLQHKDIKSSPNS